MAMADVADSRPAKKKKLRHLSDFAKITIIADLEEGCRDINRSSSRREKMEATPARVPPENKSPAAEKMPSKAELEDFFLSAEKQIHKNFTDKYNFDVVNEVPLQGRYEWVQIKP